MLTAEKKETVELNADSPNNNEQIRENDQSKEKEKKPQAR